ncbi:hypothetical protein ACFL41_02545, partial [Gemmatimonadota bacterium]
MLPTQRARRRRDHEDEKGFHTAIAGGGLGLGLAGCAKSEGGIRRARKSLNILILGGTSFIGPAQVEYAL